MAIDLKSWISELAAEGSLSAEDQGLLLEKLNKPQVIKRIEEGQLRQSDYSRAMNALSEKEKATLKLQQDLIAWKNEAETKIKAANMSLADERAAKAQLEAKVRTIAEQNGWEPESLGLQAPTAGNPAPNSQGANPNPNPQNPTGDFVSKAEYEAQQKLMAQNYPLLPAVIFDLSVQHQTLFGKPLANSADLVKKAIETGKPIPTVWEEEYKVAERRAQLQEEGIQQRINDAVAQERAKLMSENNLPAPPRPEARSPILSQFQPSNPTTGQPEMSAVDKAVAAYNSHQYAPGTQTATP